MSKHDAAPALAVDVRELLRRPGAHKHVVVRARLDDLATPVASVPPDRPVTVDAEIESAVEGLLVSGGVSVTAVLPGDRLPLDTMARDALVLGFPGFPLCRPDCAGLCPVCGADRNSGDCGHGGTEQLDPRWAGLAGLRAVAQEEDDASPQP
jgi:uncharacterized protein